MFELDDEDKCEDEIQQANLDSPLKTARFPPAISRPLPSSRDEEHFDGITLKNFSPTLEEKYILVYFLKGFLKI